VSESIKDYPATKWRAGAIASEGDHLVVEEPLEIRLAGRRFTLTMRTPGNDEELVSGFLLAEGFVANPTEIHEIRRVRGPKGELEPNIVDVILNVKSRELSDRLKRNFIVSSSCGVCGKTSIEALERLITKLEGNLRIASATILRLPELMSEAQPIFAATGGLHAAALFDVSAPEIAQLIVLREDVGRHNAVDKVIGHALTLDRLPLVNCALIVSGRLSFEIVQKAAAASIAILCAVSAPSSLAVELADELGVTLVGFLRGTAFNAYTHNERILM